MKTVAAVVAAASVLVAAKVQANTITLPIDGIFRTTYTGPKQVLIPRFNPALGTLNSATIEYTVEYSGTAAGTATGQAGSPNGWSTEFSGKIYLSGIGFGLMDYGAYNSRSGLVYQPNTPIFENFPAANIPGGVTFSQGLSEYVGTGNAIASLSWPTLTTSLTFSQGGLRGPVTRDLGALGGQVIYNYTPVPDHNGFSIMALAFGCIAAMRKRFSGDPYQI